MERSENDLLNLLTRYFDWLQRRLRNIREFSADPECIYRLSIGSAPRDTTLTDGTRFRRGEPIGILHIWGDHIPKISPSGITLDWATHMSRALRKSNRLLARYVADEQSLRSLPAFGNDAFLFYTKATVLLLERVGFTVQEQVPADGLWERFRLQIVCRWTWLLRRAFNQQSVRDLKPSDLQYRPIWLSRRVLLEKYG